MKKLKRIQMAVNAFPLARDFEISIDSKMSILIEVDSKKITLEVLQREKDNYVCKLHLSYAVQTPEGNNFITRQQLVDLFVVASCEDCSNELHDKFIYYLKFIVLAEEIWEVKVVCKDSKWFIEKVA